MALNHLLSARYGGPADIAAGADQINPVLETLLAHRSVRHFLPARLPPGTLDLLIAAAQSAPNSSNLQLWSVVAVETQERKERLAGLAGNQAHIRETPLFLAWLVDVSRVRRHGLAQGIATDGTDYLDAFLTGAIDAGLAAQNVVAAAESLGLGTVYIGALRNKPGEVAQELGLPNGVFPLFGLCIGRPDPQRPASVKPRLPQAAVLHREQYVRRPVQQETADYDRRMQAFYAEQQLPVVDWSKQIVERLHDAASLKGRDRLRTALSEQGFALK